MTDQPQPETETSLHCQTCGHRTPHSQAGNCQVCILIEAPVYQSKEDKHCDRCGRITSYIDGKCYECAFRQNYQEITALQRDLGSKAEAKALESGWLEFLDSISNQTGQKDINLKRLARAVFDLQCRIETQENGGSVFVGASQ